MDIKDPFGYSGWNYIWVIAVSGFCGLVKYLNGKKKGTTRKAVTAVLTSGITGIMTFWFIKWKFPELDGAGLAFFVAVGGLMGSTAWRGGISRLLLRLTYKLELD